MTFVSDSLYTMDMLKEQAKAQQRDYVESTLHVYFKFIYRKMRTTRMSLIDVASQEINYDRYFKFRQVNFDCKMERVEYVFMEE